MGMATFLDSLRPLEQGPLWSQGRQVDPIILDNALVQLKDSLKRPYECSLWHPEIGIVPCQILCVGTQGHVDDILDLASLWLANLLIAREHRLHGNV